jgi:hypothetical protein
MKPVILAISFVEDVSKPAKKAAHSAPETQVLWLTITPNLEIVPVKADTTITRPQTIANSAMQNVANALVLQTLNA